MNQFFAILKDSTREARNGWILQAMLVLSALLILFIASISFRPTTVESELNARFNVMKQALRMDPQYGSTDFLIENYHESNPSEPWNSDYRFDLVVKAGTVDEMDRLQGNPGLPTNRSRTAFVMRQVLNYLDHIDVKPSPANDADRPTELRFAVTTQGTKTPDVQAWRHVPRVLLAFDLPWFVTSLRHGVYFMEKWLVSGIGTWVILLISVVVTSAFIPNMLAKGAYDIIVSKPIAAPVLFMYKYLGGLTFIVLLSAVTVGGSWFIIGVRTNIWAPTFLAVIPILTFYFAVLYSVSALVGVLTRSAIMAILITLLAWVAFWGIGKVNDGIANRREAVARQAEKPELPQLPKPGEEPDADAIISSIDPNAPLWGVFPTWTFPVFNAIHTITPRTYELDNRLGRLIAEGVLTPTELEQAGYGKPARENWAEMLAVSTVFIVVMLGLACWRLTTRDG